MAKTRKKIEVLQSFRIYPERFMEGITPKQVIDKLTTIDPTHQVISLKYISGYEEVMMVGESHYSCWELVTRHYREETDEEFLDRSRKENNSNMLEIEKEKLLYLSLKAKYEE